MGSPKPPAESHPAGGQPAAAAPDVKLSVAGVSKQFVLSDGLIIDALVDISFEVLVNQISVILGPSGCGKSTVLRMIAGLEDATEGRLLIGNDEVVGPGRDRGMIFQSYTSFEWLTVQQNVEYGMRLNGVAKRERRERASHFIELVRLTKFRDAYPAQLSGGMKQRIAIARTLANDPAILLLDEPFGALDAETRWTMQELLIDIINSSQVTVLMVTHDIEESIFLADHIIFMSRHPGRIREQMPVSFKSGKRIADKGRVTRMPGFQDMQQRIMQMMREENPNAAG